MFSTAKKIADEKMSKIVGILPFLTNFVAGILTVVALATSAWFLQDGWSHGLFQKCIVLKGKRKCSELNITVQDRAASICLLVAVAMHFAASVITCLGYSERRRNNFKIATAFSFIAGLVSLSGTITYAVLSVSSQGYHLQYSVYVAVAAIAWSFIATVASAVAISRIELIPKSAKTKAAEESVTDVTTLT